MPRALRLRLAALSLLGGAAAAVAGASLTACPGTDTATVFTPPEGVTLDLGDVLGSLRCGNGPDQVYKYTVVVWDAVDGGPQGAPIASNVWDCFSQAVFDNLPAADGGSTTFFLRIYAYSYAGAVAVQAPFVGGAGGDGSVDTAFWCQGGLGPDGVTCPFEDASKAFSLGSAAQWTASCTAVEPSGAPITASCSPLETVGAASDGAAEALPDSAADAMADAAESSAGEAGAPDSSTADASSPEASSSDVADDSNVSESSAPDSSTEAGD